MSNHIILQNNEKWKECIQLDPVTREKTIITRINEDDPKITGHYIRRDAGLLMIYRENGILTFSVNNREISLDDPNVSVSFIRAGHNNIFSIKHREQVFYQITYPSTLYDPLNRYDFSCYEEEDRDFLLFVFNVMNDSRRKKSIYSFPR
jgi:hypothetical protein